MPLTRFIYKTLAVVVFALRLNFAGTLSAQPTSIDTIAKYQSAVSFSNDTIFVNGMPMALFSIPAATGDINNGMFNIYNFRKHRTGYVTSYNAGDTIIRTIDPTDKSGGSFYVLTNADSMDIMRDFVCYNLLYGWYREAYSPSSVAGKQRSGKK